MLIAVWIAARSQEEVLKTLGQAGLVVEPCRDSIEAEQHARGLPCFHHVEALHAWLYQSVLFPVNPIPATFLTPALASGVEDNLVCGQ